MLPFIKIILKIVYLHFNAISDALEDKFILLNSLIKISNAKRSE